MAKQEPDLLDGLIKRLDVLEEWATGMQLWRNGTFPTDKVACDFCGARARETRRCFVCGKNACITCMRQTPRGFWTCRACWETSAEYYDALNDWQEASRARAEEWKKLEKEAQDG